MKWISIRDASPEEDQPVFYYFDIFDTVYAGKYNRCTDPEFGTHMFSSEKGWLTDDVLYWMPRNEGDNIPEPPEAV